MNAVGLTANPVSVKQRSPTLRKRYGSDLEAQYPNSQSHSPTDSEGWTERGVGIDLPDFNRGSHAKNGLKNEEKSFWDIVDAEKNTLTAAKLSNSTVLRRVDDARKNLRAQKDDKGIVETGRHKDENIRQRRNGLSEQELLQMGILRQHNVNSRLLKETRGQNIMEDIRKDLKRERLMSEKADLYKALTVCFSKQKELHEKVTLIKILWWASLLLESFVLTWLDFFMEFLKNVHFWSVLGLYALLFLVWWYLVSRKQQKLEGYPQAVELAAGVTRVVCIIAVEVAVLNGLFADESIGKHATICGFLSLARALSSYALLLVTVEKMDKEGLILEAAIEKVVTKLACAEEEIEELSR